MSEEMKVAAEGAAQSAQTSADQAQTAVAEDGQNGKESNATFSDTAAGEGTPSKGDGENEGADKKSQSKSTNAEYARRRREAERARELKKEREKAIIETLNGKNPYTGREMKDSDDVEEFLSMREIEKKGGDPVADFPEHQKARAREERLAAEEKEKEAQWFREDRSAFAKKYPDVKLDELIADEDFADYADGKVGTKPLAEIYEGFLRQTARFEDRARTRAAQAAANREASPGALGTAGGSDTGFYTPEQVDAMTKEEVKKNLDKINESMKHWK